MNHGHRHARHQRIHHMDVPEDVGRDLPPRELLTAHNLLDHGLFCQAVYGPEHRLGAQVSGALAGEEPHLAQARSQSNRARMQPVFLMEASSPRSCTGARTQKDAHGFAGVGASPGPRGYGRTCTGTSPISPN